MTWMDDKGIELLIWIYLASLHTHGRSWVVLNIEPQLQGELPTPTVA